MTKIVLDAEAFKALASDTRLQILKALDARPLTVSELARLLTLNKATVFEHLKQLMAAELAKREDDPARKWVYYRLTWKGKNVLHPENAQIFLMLGLAALGFGGAVLQTAYLAQLWLQTQSGGPDAARMVPVADEKRMAEDSANAPAASNEPQSAASNSDSSGQPVAENAGEPAPQQNLMQDGAGGASDASAWWEPLTSTYFLTLLGVLAFLGLLTLIVWTLYSGQRRERRETRARIDALPTDVNADEPAAGSA